MIPGTVRGRVRGHYRFDYKPSTLVRSQHLPCMSTHARLLWSFGDLSSIRNEGSHGTWYKTRGTESRRHNYALITPFYRAGEAGQTFVSIIHSAYTRLETRGADSDTKTSREDNTLAYTCLSRRLIHGSLEVVIWKDDGSCGLHGNHLLTNIDDSRGWYIPTAPVACGNPT